jgi:transcriptional regulator with XRE-family HTH domain
MLSEIDRSLRVKLRDREYAHSYAESFLNAFVATQIKAIREQRELTQSELAEMIGTTQTGISRIENVNYSSWSIRTLLKLARAFDVRLRVSFEPFGTLPQEVVQFNRSGLERVKRDNDPGLEESQRSVQVTNIAIWKALNPHPQIVVKDNTVPAGTTFENGDLGGFSEYAASGDKESTRSDDDRSGRVEPRRQSAFGGLRRSVGGTVQLSQFSQGT